MVKIWLIIGYIPQRFTSRFTRFKMQNGLSGRKWEQWHINSTRLDFG